MFHVEHSGLCRGSLTDGPYATKVKITHDRADKGALPLADRRRQKHLPGGTYCGEPTFCRL